MFSVTFNLEYTYSLYTQDLSSIFYQSSKSKQASLWRNDGGVVLIDNLQAIQQIVSRLNDQLLGSGVISLRKESQQSQQSQQHLGGASCPSLITVQISGNSAEFVNFARSKILKQYNQVVTKSIELSPGNIEKLLDTSNALACSQFFRKLDELSTKYDVEFIVSNFGIVTLYGYQDNVTVMESQIRILINTLLEDMYVDSVLIELSTLPVVGGVDLSNFNQIAKQSNANIYIPDLLPELFNSQVIQSTRQLPIYITGDSIPGVLVTKRLLQEIVHRVEQQSSYYIKDVAVAKGKLDLITLLNQQEVLEIMFRNGVYIEMPSLGVAESSGSTLRVQGPTSGSVKQAVDEINLLCASYFAVSIETGSRAFDDPFVFQLLRANRSCVVTSNTFGLDLLGLEGDLVSVLRGLSSRSYNNQIINSAKLAIELNTSQRDFISGKKNGKLLKVLNQLDTTNQCIVEFEPYTENNFVLNLHVVPTGTASSYQTTATAAHSHTLALLLKGIELLKLELPTELTFNVPEVFHKSIIGNGGAIIQSIMKKYNVFIKFSSSSPADNAKSGTSTIKNLDSSDMQYTLTRPHNVLIKCPHKNSKNVSLVKYEIDELVYQCCNNNIISYPNSTVYLTSHFKILKSQYVMMLNAGVSRENGCKLSSVLAIEQQTNTFIDFPKSIDDFGTGEELTFRIKGADTKSKQAGLRIGELLPKCFRMKVSFQPGRFDEIFVNPLTNQEFLTKIVYPFKLLLGVELSVYLEGSTMLEQPSYHSILIHYWDGQAQKQTEKEGSNALSRAENELKSFLRSKGFLILDKAAYLYDGIVDTPEHTFAQNSSPQKKLKSITNTHNNYNNNGEFSKAVQSKNHNQKKKNRKNNNNNNNNANHHSNYNNNNNANTRAFNQRAGSVIS